MINSNNNTRDIYLVIRTIFLFLLFGLSSTPLSAEGTTDSVDKVGALPAKSSKQATHSIAIAVVNVRYLLQHAPQSKQASKKLKQRFQRREEELDAESQAIIKFEESIKQIEETLTREQIIEKERELRSRKRTQNRALEDYREDLRLAKNIALDEVQQSVFTAIDIVRKRQNIDIVIQDFVSASERVDITKTVLSYLANKLKEDKKKTDKN